jgi:nickel transport protein
MKVFASAAGATISGYAYFNGGARAMQTRVRVTDADGHPLFERLTDDAGQFSFQATQRMDHLIAVEGNDGHMASFRITAAELPASLPAPAAAPQAKAEPTPAGVAVAGDLGVLIDQSIARQIRPLREQIDAYQEKIWWHDVIGGIGYIVGVAGLAYGWANRRPRLK